MRSGIILYKKAGQLLPDDLVLKVLELYPTAVGYASPQGEQVEAYNFDPAEIDLAEAMVETQEKYKDNPVYFHCTKVDDVEKEFDADSFQPFSILLEGDKPIVSVMLEGEFIDYSHEGRNTPEYHAVNEYLSDKITSIYQQAGGDMAKMLEDLVKPVIRKDMLAQLRPRGVIVVIPATGTPVSFTENNLGKEYSFGYITKDVGYVEPEQENVPEPEVESEPEKVAEPATPPKPLTLRERKAREEALAKSTGTATSVPVVRPIASTKPIIKAEPPWDGSDERFFMKDGEQWIRPKRGASWSEIKHFYNSHCSGTRPKDQRVVAEGFPASQLRQTSPLREFITGKNTAFKDAMQKAKEDAPKIAAAAVDQRTPPTDPLPLGVIPADDKKKTVESVKVGIEHLSAEELKERTRKWEPYSKQIGIPLATILKWPPEHYFKLSHRELTWLCNELRMILVSGPPQRLEAPVTAPAQAPAAPLTARERLAAKRAAAAA